MVHTGEWLPPVCPWPSYLRLSLLSKTMNVSFYHHNRLTPLTLHAQASGCPLYAHRPCTRGSRLLSDVSTHTHTHTYTHTHTLTRTHTHSLFLYLTLLGTKWISLLCYAPRERLSESMCYWHASWYTRRNTHKYACSHTYTHTHTHIDTHRHTHTCTHTNLRTYAYTHIHTHEHTHTHTHTQR
jgi:hypothetical protein